MTYSLSWQTIDDVAAPLGAGDAARLKWRQRGIPADWRIKIFEALKARGQEIGFSDFDSIQQVRA